MSDAFSYHLPPELIANAPASPRDHSRLLTIDRQTGALSHHHFYDLPKLLRPTDVLVFNDSQVIPARLHGTKSTGGYVEVLLLRKREKGLWEVISHPGLKPGQIINFPKKVSATVISPNSLRFMIHESCFMNQIGKTPLPPYIKSSVPESKLRRQYQTVYADPHKPGSAAAPTAGLHFTKRLLNHLTLNNITMEFVTLHVGLGTFKSPTPDQLASGKLHSEFFTLDADTATRLNQAKSQGRRIIAIGTTTTRVLESCAHQVGYLHHVSSGSGDTNIFIKDGYKFKFVDGLITNFHLPGSSLLMLVSAFASSRIIMSAYHEAIKCKYRFYSFGDSSLLL